jgi:HAD superfamily hydrolase (TIGR01509 family)
VYDLLIFDNDGTLVDSEFLCQVAMADALAERGHDLDARALSAEFLGWELARVVAALAGRLGEDLDDVFVERYRARMLERLATDLQPMPGAPEALDALADHPAARCVASGGPRPKIELALEVTGLRRHFGDAIHSSYDIGAFKPEPDLFLHVAEHHGVAPARCLVVEDSPVGVTAGRRAGMDVVHVGPQARDDDGVWALARLDALPGWLAERTP